MPAGNPRSLLRVAGIALAAYVVFAHLLIPLRIQGKSMEPTYRDGGFNFCWRLKYLLHGPERQDVVMVRFAGKKAMLLKRVVGLSGETVAFRNGALFVNGLKQHEPYVKFPCSWNLAPRTVKPRHVYVVGDNRNVPAGVHDFGQVSVARIIGGPLWGGSP